MQTPVPESAPAVPQVPTPEPTEVTAAEAPSGSSSSRRRVLALGSILKEIVVVDDGSTDRTAAIVQSLQRYEPRIHFHKLGCNSG